MLLKRKYIYIIPFIIFLVTIVTAPVKSSNYSAIPQEDDTVYRKKLKFSNPDNMKIKVDYDVDRSEFYMQKKVGDKISFGTPIVMDESDYINYNFQRALRRQWIESNQSKDQKLSIFKYLPKLKILENNPLKGIIDYKKIKIDFQGSVELRFGVEINETKNPILTENQQKNYSFKFDNDIQANVTGQIGPRIKLDFNYNTNSIFEFDRRTLNSYTGEEDDIIKKIEVGNVSMPVDGTLIPGSFNLKGVKTKLQFGKVTVTSVFSRQEGESSVMEIKGGAQNNEFEFAADSYESNKHYFLANYFRDNYNRALEKLPIINSQVNITKLEVWITNKRNHQDYRDVAALVDLGENVHIYSKSFVQQKGNNPLPNNDANTLYGDVRAMSDDNLKTDLNARNANDFDENRDYAVIQARKLSETEYTYNPKLGYISLRSKLKDEILAVAFEYQIGTEKYQVGEFTNENQTRPLILKMIKPEATSETTSAWPLMMKNVYKIPSAYQIKSEKFRLNVLYRDDKKGASVNYLSEGKPKNKILLDLMNLDNINSTNQPYSDGLFDFIEGVTINAREGRVIFPQVEPFGKDLKAQFDNESIAKKYVYEELYKLPQSEAKQTAEKNKFTIKGTFQSDYGSEIKLGTMNVPRGSVKVTANGQELIENVDFEVDYNLGAVRILNQGLLQAGTPIRIAYESKQLINTQSKYFIGTHVDYKVNKKFNVGATVMHLFEKPLTSKVNIGNVPINNTLWGINANYSSEVPWITRMVDKIPFISTKEKSMVDIDFEFAQLLPGHSSAIDNAAYIDDFENSSIYHNIKSRYRWSLASIPQYQEGLIPNSHLIDDIEAGKNRALVSWYHVDPNLLRKGSPVSKEHQENAFAAEVFRSELFPEKVDQNNVKTTIQVLNVAYYPNERGPYNYDQTNLNDDGTLRDPESRWGGIMTNVTSTDFEDLNYEYIEFWMMDPFANDPENKGGDLYFNLGDISEDVLRDNRKSFEQGLKTTDNQYDNVETKLARVPNINQIVNAFDTKPSSRTQQDVGYDGLSSEKEKEKFDVFFRFIEGKRASSTNGTETYNRFRRTELDPSSDDYAYFRDDAYTGETSIPDRYKYYSGSEGNSPVATASGDFVSAASSTPDMEDINKDNNLSTKEGYYQYKVSIRPDDLEVGSNFIVDKREYTFDFDEGIGSKKKVMWYQFKIPISKPNKIVGNISDFRSIRFVRMFMTKFRKPVIMRFASLDFVRSNWRRYEYELNETGDFTSYPENSSTQFNISSVGIELNSGNYVLPPGIEREQDPNNPALIPMDERSMVFEVENLEDGDARAAYKNVNLDIMQFKNIRMEVHAEQLGNEILRDNELSLFVRIGTDYRQNYYEYELPLVVTPDGDYSNGSATDRARVWPEENSINISLEKLIKLKLARNKYISEHPELDFTYKHSAIDPDDPTKVMSVRGNPHLSSIKTIMIGVRNKKAKYNQYDDDGMEKSAEIWVNELRLTNFREEGGWAANTKISTKLADLGSVSMTGSIIKPGFGNVDQKMHQRKKEETNAYDISANLQLGKFFKKDAGVSIPMYVNMSETFINPEYNPLDPDVLFEDALDNLSTKKQRDSLKRMVQDYTLRRSINFTNVRIKPKKSKPKFYSISNWNMSYSFSEVYHRNIDTEYDHEKNYRGSLKYNYNFRPKNYRPFYKLVTWKPLNLIKNFNFYLLPKNISFSTNMDRRYNEIRNRNIFEPELKIPVTVNKDFIWNRTYNVKYDLSKALKITYSANAKAKIDEPAGRIASSESDYKAKRDSIISSIKDFGRITDFSQKLTVTYQLPFNYIKPLNWINGNLEYNGTYNWRTSPYRTSAGDNPYGNDISNSNQQKGRMTFNFSRLYKKSKFLKKQLSSRSRKTRPFVKKRVTLRKKQLRKFRHKFKTKNLSVRVTNSKNRPVNVKVNIPDDRTVEIEGLRDMNNLTVTIKPEISAKSISQNIMKAGLRLLFSAQNLSVTYTESKGSSLYGYSPDTKFFGLETLSGNAAPGIPYVFGWTTDDFMETASKEGWLSKSEFQNNPFMRSNSKDLTVRMKIEPIKDLKITLTAKRKESNTTREYFSYVNGYDAGVNSIKNGSFSMTVMTLPTAFDSYTDRSNFSSKYFNKFLENRQAIAVRLAKERGEYDPANLANGYPKQYDGLSQEVLIPAFLAAYTGRSTSSVSLSAFPKLSELMPNWQITYNGLSKIPFLKKYFNNITLQHKYSSTYTVGSYQTNSNFEDFINGGDEFIENNLRPSEFDINSVDINEKFSPLIGVNVTMKNSFSFRMKINRSRKLLLGLTNSQIMETGSDEYVFGAGYKIKQVAFSVRSNSETYRFKSDIDLKADVSIRNNRTMLRRIDDLNQQITAGKRIVKIRLTGDYKLNKNLNFRLFYERDVNDPFVSNSFLTANTNWGISLRFTMKN